MTAHHSTQEIKNQILLLGKDATFTGPELRAKFFPKMRYTPFYNKLQYLAKTGVLEKTNAWTGENNVVFKVKVDPEAIDLSPLYTRRKAVNNPAKSLFKAIQNKQANAKSHTSVNIVEAIDGVANLLTDILEVAKSHPAATIKNFTTAELISELERRTQNKH